MMAVPLKEQRPRGTGLIYHRSGELLVGQQPILTNKFSYADTRMLLLSAMLHLDCQMPIYPPPSDRKLLNSTSSNSAITGFLNRFTGPMPYLGAPLLLSMI